MPEIPLGIWRHFKGGYYEVIAVAVHATTADLYVIYRSSADPHWTWARPVEEFTEEVDFDEETKIPRFIYVGPSNCAHS